MLGFPNAKINLGLYITSKRADGYHDLSSCFYPIPLEEALEVIPSDTFRFSSSGFLIPGNSNANLVVKAYELLKQKYPIGTSHLHLHKAIPMGAGLGGGSADAAMTLILLNQLYRLELSKDELLNLSSQLGSDCPFFIHNTPCIATSKGEVLNPIAFSLKGYLMLLIYPGVHISTQEAYALIKPCPLSIDLAAVLKEEPHTWKNRLSNQFEEPLFTQFRELRDIKKQLYELGAAYASMSGSGSAMYGIFKTPPPIYSWPKHYLVKELKLEV